MTPESDISTDGAARETGRAPRAPGVHSGGKRGRATGLATEGGGPALPTYSRQILNPRPSDAPENLRKAVSLSQNTVCRGGLGPWHLDPGVQGKKQSVPRGPQRRNGTCRPPGPAVTLPCSRLPHRPPRPRTEDTVVRAESNATSLKAVGRGRAGSRGPGNKGQVASVLETSREKRETHSVKITRATVDEGKIPA